MLPGLSMNSVRHPHKPTRQFCLVRPSAAAAAPCIPKVMMSRLSHNGVAPITWVDINGSPVAIGSGGLFVTSM
jgi:hypothetical protein